MSTLSLSQLKQNIHTWTREVDYDRKQLIVVMQKIQHSYHSISEESMQILANDFQIQPAEVFSLATFFTSFCTQPKGKYTFKVCRGMSCDLEMKEGFLSLIQDKLEVKFNGTSPDGLFCLEFTQCMGMCDQGPVISVNDHIFTGITPQKLETIIDLCKQSQNIPLSQPDLTPIALWEGRSETSSYELIRPGSVLSSLNIDSPEAVLDEMVKNQVISMDMRSKFDSSRSEAAMQHVLVCNTDLPQTGSFIERILLADHYDLFVEGFLASAFLACTHEGIIYLRPEYEGLHPVLASYLENLSNLTDPTSEERFGCNVDIRTSPGFVAGGVGKVLEVAINSDRFTTKDASLIPSSAIQIDVKTIVEIGHYLSKKKRRPDPSKETSTRIFAISGDCTLPGIYEMPVDSSIADCLKISGSHNPKAVQVGGTFGKFILPSQFDDSLPITNDIGDASIIVYGSETDFHDVAIKLLQYSAFESCGQCAPCRVGSAKLLEKFQTMKKGRRFSVLELNSIIDCMQLASKCEFGQNTMTGFQSLIQCFPDLV